jgi:hypothetical protein
LETSCGVGKVVVYNRALPSTIFVVNVAQSVLERKVYLPDNCEDVVLWQQHLLTNSFQAASLSSTSILDAAWILRLP